MTRLVALGDSISCGEGVGLRLPMEATWLGRLVAAVPGGELMALARAGAQLSDVRRDQLPAAVGARADVVTVLIGLNDVSRSGFDPVRFRNELGSVVEALLATPAIVLLGRLHDPTLALPLPRALRSAVRERVAAVNAAVDAWEHPRLRRLDLSALQPLRDRRMWDVDRLHPNPAGHAVIAAAAAHVLRHAGIAVGPVHLPPPPAAPGALRETAWALRHGLPWLASHVPQVVVPAVAATARRQAQPA